MTVKATSAHLLSVQYFGIGVLKTAKAQIPSHIRLPLNVLNVLLYLKGTICKHGILTQRVGFVNENDIELVPKVRPRVILGICPLNESGEVSIITND